MKSKAQEQPRENIQSKIWQSGELLYVFSIGAQTNNFKLVSKPKYHVNSRVNENCCLKKRFSKVS